MSDPYVGEIRYVGFNFAPVGWLTCDGSLLSISEYTVLFSLLGTTYGGNGTTTFALPDLRGRVAIHQGILQDSDEFVMGEQSGSETVSLLTSQIPLHSHTINTTSALGNVTSPAGALLAKASSESYAPFAENAGTLASSAVSLSGGSIPHSNIQPFQAIYCIIAFEGIYPSQG